MSAQELRSGFASLVSEVRAAGRGAPRSTLDSTLDRFFPVLVSAADLHHEAVRSPESKAKGLALLLAEAAEAAERHRNGLTLPRSNGEAHGIAWPWTRVPSAPSRRLAWGIGLMGAAAVVLLAIWLTGQLGERKDHYVAPGPKGSGPVAPAPGLAPQPKQAPIVERDPKTDVWVRPIPRRPKPQERVAAKPPEAGSFGGVMGEPLVFAPGSEKGVLAKPGMALAYGSRIETGDADKLELKFADGTLIQLGYNTIISLSMASEELLLVRPDQIQLETGQVYAKVVHLEESKHFKVKTPVATAEVMGTEFKLTVIVSRKTSIADVRTQAVLDVRSGQVKFGNSFGSVLATDLMRSTAITGKAPTDPVRIRAFPSLHSGTSSRSFAQTTAPMPASTALGAMAPQQDWNGLQVDTIDGRIAVTKVLAGSVAQQAGFQVRDVILAVNGRTTSLHWDLVTAPLRSSGNQLELTVQRNGETLLLSLPEAGSSLPFEPDLLSVDRQFGAFLWEVGMTRTRARKALEELIRRQPHPAYWNNLGLLWQVDDELGKALRCYRKAISMAPNHPLYRFNYSQALTSIGNFDRADEEVRRVVSQAPNWVGPLLMHVDALLRRDQVDQALALVEQAEQHFPSSAAFLYSKAGIFRRQGRIQEAIAAYERYLEKEPSSSAALGSLASIMMSLGRSEDAIRYWRKALESNPQSTGNLNNLGEYLASLGQVEEGVQLLRKAILHDPGDPVAYANLGAILGQAGRTAEAEPLLRKAVQVNPEYGTTYTNLGFLLWKQGKTSEAEAMLRKALDLDPRSPMACANLGSMLSDDMGKKAEAVALYRTFLKLNAGTGIILNNLAAILSDLGIDLDEALEAAKGAVEAAPNRPNRVWTLADVYRARKEWDLAEAAYRKAIELYGSSTDAGECWEALGEMFEKKGDPASAKGAYVKAISIDPKVNKAPAALKRLGG